MREKIDWYQEVVDLEPGSKLFFPLAKMLANNNETSRALTTLFRGLERNPEFIEARLFLVELLHKSSPNAEYAEELEKQLSIVAPLLARYAGFWQAWGENAKDYGMQGDTSLILSFLAASFQQKNLSLSDIFAAGLQSLKKDSLNNPKNAEPTANSVKTDSPVQDKPIQIVGKISSFVVPKNLPEPSADTSFDASFTQKKHVQENKDEQEEGEEYSLRTRSMAEVLAEQSDYEGALSIYNELMQAAHTEAEKVDLQYRINTLTANLNNTKDQETKTVVESPSPAKDRVLSVLESLAERLESRVTS